MANESTRYLFVYGTLMSGAGTALGKSQRLRLARESDSLGPASIAHAHLYDLGRYPGAIAAGGLDDPRAWRSGPALRSAADTRCGSTPTRALCPGKREESEYDRVIRDVKLAGGEAIEAWVYLLRAAPPRRSAHRGWPLDAALVSQRAYRFVVEAEPRTISSRSERAGLRTPSGPQSYPGTVPA